MGSDARSTDGDCAEMGLDAHAGRAVGWASPGLTASETLGDDHIRGQ